jgi:hypothetical protein
MRRRAVFVFASAILSLIVGCQAKAPEMVNVQGKVTLDGQPLPHAIVQFVPQLDKASVHWESSGETDDDGDYSLTCNWEGKSGACVATHRVLVSELAPEPEWGADIRSLPEIRLPNRPIPAEYGAVGSTPLIMDVVPGKTQIDLPLSRSQSSK